MTAPTVFPADLNATDFLKALMASATTKAVEEMLSKLPIVDANYYNYDDESPEKN